MYNKVDAKLDFLKNEAEVLAFWKENDVFKKSLVKNEKDGKPFVIYDGPPTANGMPHVGHVLARAMKDIVPRYKTMKGYYVPRKAGWDTHGLPVELEVEKEIGSHCKKDIETYGVEKFIEKCKENVWKYKSMWEKFTDKVGYWVDMDDPYITYSNEYMESIFWSLKEFDKKGLIYKGVKVTPYCTRCGTPLSSAEVDQGYKKVKDNSIFVKFKLANEDTYFLVWTTTPWTLPSNVALCVNPNETYAKFISEGVHYIMLESLIPTLFETYEIEKRYKGIELEYTPYIPMFDYAKDEVEKGYFVTADEYVTTEDGTGIVHIAPAFGADDFEVAKKYGISFVQLIGEDGCFVDKATKYAKINAKKADKIIIEDLKAEGKLFKVLPIEHEYPHCWRCDTPLLYFATTSWFIKTSSYRDLMAKNNDEVYWQPESFKKGRMGNFLANNIDWCISRNRYWGTPLPFWICENGHTHVVGSVEELKQLSGEKEIKDLHKPTLDKITFDCPICKAKMKRTSEVMDCWYESGSMPFAQLHYPFENKDKFEKLFPADFICEGVDQTRGWFNSLHQVSAGIFGKTPFKACTAVGMINDAKGQKMSKSKGNGIDPMDILNRDGADGLRWYFYHNNIPGNAMSFIEENLVELQHKFMGTLWNVYAFYILYAEIDKFDPTKYNLKDCKLSFIDKWLLSEYNELLKFVTDKLDNFNMLDSSRKITEFVDMLSNWYVRCNRERYWASGETEDKISAYMTLYTVLSSLVKMIAPFVPFISEKIYQNLVRSVEKNAPISVHLCDYPETDESLIDEELNRSMEDVLDIVVLGRSARNGANVKSRQPLGRAIVVSAKNKELGTELIDLIKGELNVEAVELSTSAYQYVSYSIKPLLKVLGPKYGKDINAIREYLANVDSVKAVQTVKNGGQLEFEHNGNVIVLKEEDLFIEVLSRDEFASASDGNFTVVLDTHITPELYEKGIVREIVSKIQNIRKECDFEVTDHIKLSISGDSEIVEIANKYSAEICASTFADDYLIDADLRFVSSVSINDKNITICVEKM